MYRLWLLVLLFTIGCSSGEDFFSETIAAVQEEPPVSDSIDLDPLEIGTMNAVKKAYQMTDIVYTPENAIEANSRTYQKGTTYSGLIYSSVKELGTYVGPNVSFHTFMTAIHNPRSKIYTDRLDKPPYHGTNCRAYYGTVCSGLVSYALGVSYGSYDFPVSDVFVEVDHNIIDSIRVADVLWKSGHVALITDVSKDDEGHVIDVEICEAVQNGCKRYTLTNEKFIALMKNTFKRIYRYIELYKNVNYTPAPEFVAVLDEIPIPFTYNDYLCADKGDKACYLENEDVTINIFHDYDYLEVYKDDELYSRISSTGTQDIFLQDLPYGDYKASICYGSEHKKSDYTYWKVVNIELTPDRVNGRLYFKSVNAIPYKMNFSNLSGSRKYPFTQLYSHQLTDEERACGYMIIPQELTKNKYPYIHFSVSTEYGTIEHKPLNWFEQ